MKTLIIDARTGGDWSLDLLFAGLVRHYGPENVIDHPYHAKHREKLVFTGNPEHDWGLERRTLGYTPKNDLVVKQPDQEIFWMLQRGEIKRIFIDERQESYELYLRLRANFFKVPVVVVAGHDRFWNQSPEYVAAKYAPNLEAMFLDNWRPEYGNLPNTHVYNWSTNFDHYWTRPPRNDHDELEYKKLYDVSFMGYNSHGDRARFVDHILKKWGHLRLKLDLERTPDTMRSYVRKEEYFKVMAQSEICLNLRGAAENGKTLRFYEIPYVGSLMLTQDSGAVQVEPFQNKCHCLYFKNEDELDSHLDAMFKPGMEPIRKQLAMQGHAHAQRYHTVDARMKQILGVLDGQG